MKPKDEYDFSPAILGPLSAPIWLQVCASICRGDLSAMPSFWGFVKVIFNLSHKYF